MWAIVLALAACDSSVGETFRSGERLRLQLWDSGGVRVPLQAGFYGPRLFDRARQESCSLYVYFDSGTNGVPTIRCLPDGQARDVYTDAACTQHAAIRPSRSCDPCYAVSPDPAVPVLRLTGPSVATRYYEKRTDGVSTQCAGPYDGSVDDVVGISADEFATVQLTEPQGDGPVQWTYFESADGLHVIDRSGYVPSVQRSCSWEAREDAAICFEPATQQTVVTATPTSTGRLRTYRADDELLSFLTFDAALAVECAFIAVDDVTWRCIPSQAPLFRSAFSDSLCTTPNKVIVTGRNGQSLIPLGVDDGRIWTTTTIGPAYDLDASGQCQVLLFRGDTTTEYLGPGVDVSDDYVGVTVEVDPS
ncbi:MAG TPA: hypothetical protein VFQ53_37915 [Kofleriaceae bacterium]|nr:hypothetical protein [Kofleriaceae bacterium]